MTLQKTLEILKDILYDYTTHLSADDKTALIMSADGLARIKAYRRLHIAISFMPLKGETLD